MPPLECGLASWRDQSRAGYGAMRLAGGGAFGQPRDRDEALRVLRAAVAAGVNPHRHRAVLRARHGERAHSRGLAPPTESLDVLAECEARNIAFVPFCPLGRPGDAHHRLLADPVLVGLAARLGATPARIALAWLLDLAPNILLIPGTGSRAHLAENLGAAGDRLDDAARADLTRRVPSTRIR